MTFIKGLGGQGLVGLVAIAVVFYILNRSSSTRSCLRKPRRRGGALSWGRATPVARLLMLFLDRRPRAAHDHEPARGRGPKTRRRATGVARPQRS